ncbi:MAG: tetratricopeptide repeat protein [Kiritimatiellia bacterium]
MSDTPADHSKRAAPSTGYLYHQQVPEPPQRSARRKNAPARKPKPSSAANLGQKYFLANLRTFLVVLAGMGLLVLLAYVATQQMGRLRESRSKKKVEEWKKENDKRLAERPKSPLEQAEAEQVAAVTETFNTDNIRKATYLSKLGEVAMQEKNYKVAIERYKEALALAPYLHKIWADLGSAYLEDKDPARARIALERAVQGDATNPGVLCNLGLSYLNLKMFDQALKLFEAALDVDPGFPRTNFYLAKVYLQRKEYEPAMLSLEKYLRAVPTDCDALREKSFILAGRGQYLVALDSVKRALAECPDKAELYWDAAATSALLQRAEDAIRYLEKGEMFTSPREAYRIYLSSPAFEGLRKSSSGKIYEKELADRARRLLQEPKE